MTPNERAIRLRLQDDFEYYAPRCLKIRTKSGAIKPFRLNAAQVYLHGQLEHRYGHVYTTIVSGEVTWPGGNIEIYIQPHPIIRRMTFSDTMGALDTVRKSNVMSSEFFVEAVAHQQAVIEEVERRAFSEQAMHPIKDKRARLHVAARYIEMGVVKFPRHGCEELITQLLGFGVERHDDAVDALIYLIPGLVGEGISPQEVHYV